MVSHISTVSAVRTARALTRAISKQLRIDDGLVVEKARKSVTVSSFASELTAKKALATGGYTSAATMASMVAGCAAIPILTALTARSPNTASICAVTKSAGT